MNLAGCSIQNCPNFFNLVQDIKSALKVSPKGTKRNLIFLSDAPAEYELGVRIRYRPTEELKSLLEGVDEAGAVKEMEKWYKEAAKVVEPSDFAAPDI